MNVCPGYATFHYSSGLLLSPKCFTPLIQYGLNLNQNCSTVPFFALVIPSRYTVVVLLGMFNKALLVYTCTD